MKSFENLWNELNQKASSNSPNSQTVKLLNEGIHAIGKKVVEEGHAGAHGGAWKIALADMMTAMMAFFLLMWLLGATNTDQRKSIADYFKPTPKSLIQSGQLAGSNGILGGRSIMDPEGMPNAASQTSILDLTPPSQNEPYSRENARRHPVPVGASEDR